MEGEVAVSTQGVSPVIMIISLVVSIIFIIAYWKIFTKAGKPGIASIVPIWNAIAFLQIAGKPAWWIVLMCIPVVNFVIAIIATIAFAKSFGKGGGFAAGLLLLSPIFILILAFGGAEYIGPGGEEAGE